jgi:hypothetical protein
MSLVAHQFGRVCCILLGRFWILLLKHSDGLRAKFYGSVVCIYEHHSISVVGFHLCHRMLFYSLLFPKACASRPDMCDLFYHAAGYNITMESSLEWAIFYDLGLPLLRRDDKLETLWNPTTGFLNLHARPIFISSYSAGQTSANHLLDSSQMHPNPPKQWPVIWMYLVPFPLDGCRSPISSFKQSPSHRP